MKKLMAIVATALLAMGIAVLAVAGPASAHNHTVTPSCSSLSINLNSYKTAGTNTVDVVIDGVHKTVDASNTPGVQIFADSFIQTYNFAQTVAHTWSVKVVAYDDSTYNVNESGTTSPCLTGTEPTWTEPTCKDSSGYYTIPTTTGIDYYVGGVKTTAGKYPAAANSTVTVTAQVSDTAHSSYTGTSSWPHTFAAVPSTANCTTLVVPVAPKVVPIGACNTRGSITLDTTPGVIYTFVTGNAAMTSGAYDIIATPDTANGYAFGPGTVQPAGLTAAAASTIPQSIEYKGTLGTFVACTVLPHDPSVSPISCTLNAGGDKVIVIAGYIEVSPVNGVTYTITGGKLTTPTVIPYTGSSAPVDTNLPAGDYTVTATGTNLAPGLNPFPLTVLDHSGFCLPTHALTSGTVSGSDQTCVSGKYVSGYITVDADPSTLATLHYELNGVTLGAKTNVAPGTYTVDIIPNKGFVVDNPTGTATVHASTTACGSLTTLAFTGGTLVGYAYLAAASMFMMAGGVFFMRSRRERYSK